MEQLCLWGNRQLGITGRFAMPTTAPDNKLKKRIMKKQDIDYPCRWPYRVIGSDRTLMEDEISIKLNHIQFEMNVSNQSKKGKYISFHVEAYINSEKERNDVFNILKNIPAVKIVF